MSDKKKTTTKEPENFVPTIVEVYGEENKPKTQNVKLKTDVQDEEVLDDEKREVVEGEREDEAPEEEERMTLETLKTEVVGADANVKLKTENSKPEPTVENKKTQDDQEFEEEIGHQKKAARGIFGVGVVIFLVIFGLTGWAFYLKTVWLSKETVTSVLVAKPTDVVEPTPSPTPETVPLTREKISLQILNGSGIVGLAGKTAKTFEDLGYTAPDTGNTSATQITELYVKQDLENQLSVLMSDVKDVLSVASVTGYLKDTDTMTARIVLGK